MRWIPNAISILRALASIPVVLLVAPGTALLALALFSAAALTDALDGALARKLRASSALGAFLDPLADKVLVLGTLGGLLARGAVDPLPVGLILVREIAVTGVRAIAATRGVTVGSNAFGKAKAGLQGAAVAGHIVALAWPTLALGPAADALLWGAALMTVATGSEVIHR
ncbi:MAG: CDP-alcohol phosphatidyltransferase family protein [Chloroflexi bacterium]|nr:CDP-alcohol phosphatidyltransferase family protein [Chloroflexota bacterium]